MNKKAQTMATILIGFIAVIVALALFLSSAQLVGDTSSTGSLDEAQYTMPADSVTIDLVGQELLSTPTLTNMSNGSQTVDTTNYTLEERVSTVDGLKRITLTAAAGPYVSQAINVSYDYGSEGYIEDSGARSIAALITLFAALAVGIIFLAPVMKEIIVSLR